MPPMPKRFARRLCGRRCALCRSRRPTSKLPCCCTVAGSGWDARLPGWWTPFGGFRSGREFGAWLGLVPRQNSTGGKHRWGGISKRGNKYLRRLLINGASVNLLRSKATNADPWVIGLRRRRPPLVVAVALANKTARIAWAVMHRHENYQRVAAAA